MILNSSNSNFKFEKAEIKILNRSLKSLNKRKPKWMKADKIYFLNIVN
jgi:hypothetical protein